jgi:hypothetical protein
MFELGMGRTPSAPTPNQPAHGRVTGADAQPGAVLYVVAVQLDEGCPGEARLRRAVDDDGVGDDGQVGSHDDGLHARAYLEVNRVEPLSRVRLLYRRAQRAAARRVRADAVANVRVCAVADRVDHQDAGRVRRGLDEAEESGRQGGQSEQGDDEDRRGRPSILTM